MFRALLAHLQEVLHKQHLVCCMRVMPVGCTSSTLILVQPTDITHTHNTPSVNCAAPPEDEQAMLKTCRGPEFLIN
jgi:hypothetical protein